jgi:hypothetical protein
MNATDLLCAWHYRYLVSLPVTQMSHFIDEKMGWIGSERLDDLPEDTQLPTGNRWSLDPY